RAEDGIRPFQVTGVQTCALPICGLDVSSCPASGGGYPTNFLLGHDCDGPCQPSCPVREVGAASGSYPIFRLESKTPAAERVEVVSGRASRRRRGCVLGGAAWMAG